jgi:hypothetical protein
MITRANHKAIANSGNPSPLEAAGALLSALDGTLSPPSTFSIDAVAATTPASKSLRRKFGTTSFSIIMRLCASVSFPSSP